MDHWHEGGPCPECPPERREPAVTTYEEWRVTGTWDDMAVDYEFSPSRLPNVDPETAARSLAAQAPKQGRMAAWCTSSATPPLRPSKPSAGHGRRTRERRGHAAVRDRPRRRYGYVARIAFGCTRCDWEAAGPDCDEHQTLAELVQRAEEHTEVCR